VSQLYLILSRKSGATAVVAVGWVLLVGLALSEGIGREPIPANNSVLLYLGAQYG
jgi:hypothetical protein